MASRETQCHMIIFFVERIENMYEIHRYFSEFDNIFLNILFDPLGHFLQKGISLFMLINY